MKILQFFQGPDGENSSKRLAGILTTLVMLALSSVGGYAFLKNHDYKNFLDLIDTLCLFASGMLVTGLADIFLKKHYGKNLPNPPSS
jgi:hypothetical protein